MDEGIFRALGCYQRPKSGQDWEHESLTLTSLLIKPISPGSKVLLQRASISEGLASHWEAWREASNQHAPHGPSLVGGKEGRIFLNLKLAVYSYFTLLVLQGWRNLPKPSKALALDEVHYKIQSSLNSPNQPIRLTLRNSH